MPDSEQNKQSDFMIEKIKERPVNKKKLLRRTVITAAMAVIFGLIACLTFLILEPVFSNWLYPEEKPQYVEFPEETDEMLPEDMIVEEEPEPDLQETVENVLQQQGGQIEEILSRWVLDAENYKQLYAAMDQYTADLNLSMVTVTGVTSDTDWFQNTFESTGQVSGVIIANNQKELLILVDSTPLRNVDSISVTFYNGQKTQAQIKQEDRETGLAVLAVQISDVSENTLTHVQVAELGSSSAKTIVGVPVVALGSPMGISGSMDYGMVTAAGIKWSTADANYDLLLTNIYGSQNASGVLFNMNKQVVGIITTGKKGTDMDNVIMAFGISDLRKLIGKMSNGTPVSYMGISGVDVTIEVNRQEKVPLGAYITDVVMDSPAMLAGVQRGDIIVRMEDTLIGSFSDYTTTLFRMRPGEKVKMVVQRQVQDDYKEVEFEITVAEKN